MGDTQERRPTPVLTVDDMVRESRLGLEYLSGRRGGNRPLTVASPQKSGLVLAGQTEHLNPAKVQVLGLTEISYLEGLTPAQRQQTVNRLAAADVVCFVVTKNLTPPKALLTAASLRRIPVLRTPEKTSLVMRRLGMFLERELAPRMTLHGVLMTIQGVGVLILGKSGIGKSECALDLVYQGHRLVADDLIFLRRLGNEVIVGAGSELIRHHMEIRGLGIINIKELFGVISVVDDARVELVVELVAWDPNGVYDRLGLEEGTTELLGVDLPMVSIPVSPGRNLSVILEVAARNHLLKKGGFHAARNVEAVLSDALKSNVGAEERRGSGRR